MYSVLSLTQIACLMHFVYSSFQALGGLTSVSFPAEVMAACSVFNGLGFQIGGRFGVARYR